MKNLSIMTFQELIFNLKKFWAKQGCSIIQPLDIEIGAGTFHPITFFKALETKSAFFAYVQASRRPTDGRYGKHPNRLQHYYQFQVIIKPPLKNIQNLYLESLEYLKFNLSENDLLFVEDNWSNPTLGAYGVGWEVWINGLEITQFTYFQKIGGLNCSPIMVEITYGLERIAMEIQRVSNFNEIIWNKNINTCIKYKDLFYLQEKEQSNYNFNYANTKLILDFFNKFEIEINNLLNLKNPLIIPAYEFLLKIIHFFNILESRNTISITERQDYILRIRKLSNNIAKMYNNYKK